MKKLIVIALVVVMALSIAAFAACGPSGEVEGEYKYVSPYDATGASYYGVKVTVTVKNGVITEVKLADDTATLFNVSASWDKKATWLDGQAAFVESFVGLSVDEVKAIKVTCDAETVGSGWSYTAVKGQPTKVEGAPSSLKVVTGATQSSGRVILAVQDALSKLGK